MIQKSTRTLAHTPRNLHNVLSIADVLSIAEQKGCSTYVQYLLYMPNSSISEDKFTGATNGSLFLRYFRRPNHSPPFQLSVNEQKLLDQFQVGPATGVPYRRQQVALSDHHLAELNLQETPAGRWRERVGERERE